MNLDNIFIKHDTDKMVNGNDIYMTERNKLLDDIDRINAETEVKGTKRLSKISDDTNKLINNLNEAMGSTENMGVIIQGLLNILKETQISNAKLRNDNKRLSLTCTKYEEFTKKQHSRIKELETIIKNNPFC